VATWGRILIQVYGSTRGLSGDGNPAAAAEPKGQRDSFS